MIDEEKVEPAVEAAAVTEPVEEPKADEAAPAEEAPAAESTPAA